VLTAQVLCLFDALPLFSGGEPLQFCAPRRRVDGSCGEDWFGRFAYGRVKRSLLTARSLCLKWSTTLKLQP
jgi:hypothetical protein